MKGKECKRVNPRMLFKGPGAHLLIYKIHCNGDFFI